ncbi:MAG: hypothetical protein WCE62_11820 [Polyangiales bacterium]
MRIALVSPSLVCLLLGAGCEQRGEPAPLAHQGSAALTLPSPEGFSKQHPTFDAYWYQGKAELTRYALRQSRYGELHDGDAVLIFVTEDFLSTQQVKQEHGDSPEAVSVLKLNAYRRFYTGIYPYTIMTTSFTPVRPPGAATLKIGSTVQEWCGQVYTQLNRRDDGLHTQLHSYFQDEGDQNMILPNATLEDGIWAQIRVDPDAVQEGKQVIIPGLDYLRLRHEALRAYSATVTRTPDAETDLVDHTLTALRVSYAELGRDLVIYYEPDFPHVIQAWEENIGSQRSTAVRTHAIIDDYWHHNAPADSTYREALGLTR